MRGLRAVSRKLTHLPSSNFDLQGAAGSPWKNASAGAASCEAYSWPPLIGHQITGYAAEQPVCCSHSAEPDQVTVAVPVQPLRARISSRAAAEPKLSSRGIRIERADRIVVAGVGPRAEQRRDGAAAGRALQALPALRGEDAADHAPTPGAVSPPASAPGLAAPPLPAPVGAPAPPTWPAPAAAPPPTPEPAFPGETPPRIGVPPPSLLHALLKVTEPSTKTAAAKLLLSIVPVRVRSAAGAAWKREQKLRRLLPQRTGGRRGRISFAELDAAPRVAAGW